MKEPNKRFTKKHFVTFLNMTENPLHGSVCTSEDLTVDSQWGLTTIFNIVLSQRTHAFLTKGYYNHVKCLI